MGGGVSRSKSSTAVETTPVFNFDDTTTIRQSISRHDSTNSLSSMSQSFSKKVRSFTQKVALYPEGEIVSMLANKLRLPASVYKMKKDYCPTAGLLSRFRGGNDDDEDRKIFSFQQKSPSKLIRQDILKQHSHSFVMLKAPPSMGSGERIAKIVERNELEKKLIGNAKNVKKRKGNVKLVMELLATDTVKLKFSKDEISLLAAYFRRNCDNKKDETMSKYVFMNLFRSTIQQKSALGSFKNTTLENNTLETLFESLDGDSSGFLTLVEFLKGFSIWRDIIARSSDRFMFIFSMFDADQSGELSFHEFSNFVEYTVLLELNRNKKVNDIAVLKTVDRFVKRCWNDACGSNGYISLKDFLTWLDINKDLDLLKSLGCSRDVMKTAFEVFDRFANGYLSPTQFETMVKSTQLHTMYNSQSRILKEHLVKYTERLVKNMNKTMDDIITYDEFRNWLRENDHLEAQIAFEAKMLTQIAYSINAEAFVEGKKEKSLVMKGERKQLKSKSTNPKVASFKVKPPQRSASMARRSSSMRNLTQGMGSSSTGSDSGVMSMVPNYKATVESLKSSLQHSTSFKMFSNAAVTSEEKVEGYPTSTAVVKVDQQSGGLTSVLKGGGSFKSRGGSFKSKGGSFKSKGGSFKSKNGSFKMGSPDTSSPDVDSFKSKASTKTRGGDGSETDSFKSTSSSFKNSDVNRRSSLRVSKFSTQHSMQTIEK